MPSRQNIHRTDKIGVFFKAALDAFKLRLCLPVVFRHMAAAWAGLTGVLRRHGDNETAIPCCFVFQLSAKLKPALLENRPIQARLLFHLLAVLFAVALGRLGHTPNLQIFDGDHGVVLADLARSLVQKVFPGMGDASVNALDAGFRLPPVAAEFGFAAHGTLVACQPLLMFLEAVKRLKVAAIAHGGKAGNAQVDTDGTAGLRHRLLDLPLRLD